MKTALFRAAFLRYTGVEMSHTVVPPPRLFWFLRDGVRLDLADPAMADLYVQQIVTHGSANDVKQLLVTVDRPQLKASFGRIRQFLPVEVRGFWDDALAGSR